MTFPKIVYPFQKVTNRGRIDYKFGKKIIIRGKMITNRPMDYKLVQQTIDNERLDLIIKRQSFKSSFVLLELSSLAEGKHEK